MWNTDIILTWLITKQERVVAKQERIKRSQNSFLDCFLIDDGNDGGANLLQFGCFSMFGNDAMLESTAGSLFFWHCLKNFYLHFTQIGLDSRHHLVITWILLVYRVDKIFIESFISTEISWFFRFYFVAHFLALLRK